MRRSLTQVKQMFDGRTGTAAQRRGALARVAREIRRLDPAGREALMPAYRQLSDRAYRLKHGAPRALYKEMTRLERLPDLSQTKARGDLARLGWKLRRHKNGRAFKLWDRWRRATAKTQLPRVTARQQRSGTSDTPGARFRRGLLQAHASGTLDEPDWKVLEQRISTLPTASRQARQLLDLSYSPTTKIGPETRKALSLALQKRGYPVHIVSGAAAARRGNISETDRAFLRISRAAGRRTGDIKIGIIDGGFDPEHAALRGKFWTNPSPTKGDVHGYNFQKDTGNLKQIGYDPMGIDAGGIAHGTHVAGIATRGTHRIKAIGLAHTNITSFHLDAMKYAVDHGARVVNFSMGIWGADLVQKVLALMRDNPKVLFIQSAGNDGADLRTVSRDKHLYPNDLPNFVRVAAADRQGRPLDEGRSKTNYGSPQVTLAARAQHFSATTNNFSDTGYVHTGATSQAAPQVANVAAKCMLLAPRLAPDRIKQLLVETSNRSQHWQDKALGGGLINARRAYRLSALVGLVQDGVAPEAAAARLRLGRDRARLLALVPRYATP